MYYYSFLLLRVERYLLRLALSTSLNVTDLGLNSRPISKRVLDVLKVPNFSNTKMDVDLDFPTKALLPKKETGAAAFINKYPEYDGRGTVIAIFDSGVDPGAAGLQTTTEGNPKVIGRYNCSGFGDVDTSTVVQCVDGEILGITGKKLKVPSNWKNPSGNYHMGLKNGFELYPKNVQERVVKERKEKLWDIKHKPALADATRNLSTITKEQETKKTTVIAREDKLKKDEAEALVEVLNQLEKKYTDLGPIYDCVVFHDGEMWRACMDTSEKGDLESCSLLGEYSTTQDLACISSLDKVNYSVNVYEEGNLLEIVSVGSTHGTHVASIAAAHFPEEPERNGIAPGAQIVSLSLADNRLGDSMETGTAITRAMIHVMNTNLAEGKKIDVINMSYGEHANFSTSGRLGELMREVVEKYNVVWVCSAANHGPALCTMGVPPDISSNTLIGVGAYVSPEMMQAEYSLRQKMPGMPYTWSSRGPCIDGEKGVSICAPGGAITSVSNFTLRGCQLMNGTSMSSPNAAGCVALLISGLKARGLPYSPFSMKRALENTALFLNDLDPFAQGHGLVQVEKAFENLTEFSDAPERDVRFKVTCGPNGNKGIHIRTGVLDMPKEQNVVVEPIFLDADNIEPDKKIQFQMSLALVCSAPWVQHPAHLEMMNVPRNLNVRIDPIGLCPGVHNTCLRAYDVKKPEKGPVFRVEITVVQPHTVNPQQPELSFTGEVFEPNTIRRHFILVPDEVTWAVLRVKGRDREHIGRFMVHCVQLLPKRACTACEINKMINVSAHSETVQGFKVWGGMIVEVVLAKFWASLGSMKVDYKIEFHGCRPDQPIVTMVHGDKMHEVVLNSGLRSEEVVPSISLKEVVSVLRPTEAKVEALSARDIVPPARQIYQLLLTYSFHLGKTFEVTPYSPLLNHMLYELEFESQLWMLYDTNKQLLTSGDAYKKKYNIKLEKGDYTIRHQVRYEKKDVLEKMTDLPFVISHKLATPISMEIYGNKNQALLNVKKITSAMLPVGKQSLPIYIPSLPAEKLQKLGVTGNYLKGNITYAKDEIGKKCDSYKFKYILTDSGKKQTPKNNNEKEKTKKEEYEEALRDLKVSWLSKQDNREVADELYGELEREFDSHLAIHSAMMAHLEPESREWPGSSKPLPLTTVSRIYTIAAKVIERVDTTELLAYIGTKSDQRPDAAKIKQSMDRQKSALIDALARYGSAQCRLYKSDEKIDVTKPTLEDIDQTYINLLRFSDSIDKVTGHFVVWHACVHQHYGRMLKALSKLYEEKPSKELEEATIWAMRQLGWHHCANLLASTTLARFPSNYRSF